MNDTDYDVIVYVNLMKNETFYCGRPLKNVIFMTADVMYMIFLAIFAMFFPVSSCNGKL